LSYANWIWPEVLDLNMCLDAVLVQFLKIEDAFDLMWSVNMGASWANR